MSSSGPRTHLKLLTVGDFDPETDQAIEYDFIGRVIAGRYTVREQIGGGGMADVFRATDIYNEPTRLAEAAAGVDIPPAIAAVIESALHKHPNDRPQTMLAFAEALQAAAAQSSASPPYRRRHEFLLGVGLGVTLTWLATPRPNPPAALASTTETDGLLELPTDPTVSSLTTSTSSTFSTSSTSSATTTTTSTAGSTGMGGICGDSVVDPGEDCDLGTDNRDDGPCTLDCEAAVCGDGKIWADVEACDLAGDNSEDYAGCSHLCQLNPRCGDAIVDVPLEQCDAGPANGSAESGENTVPCTIGCRWDGRVAFLTSAVYDADLGGLDGADQKCRTLGKAAGMARWETLRAWISSGEVGPLDRFVLLPAKPYVLPTGERIADSLSDLVLDGPGDGIRVDEATSLRGGRASRALPFGLGCLLGQTADSSIYEA